MEAVIGLLLIILRVSDGVEMDCDGRHDGAQCYRALGGSVVIKLMDRVPETFKLIKYAEAEEEILFWTDNKMINNQLEERSLFTLNDGKFRINSLSRSDGGKYTLELFNSQGHKLEQRTLQLTIQAPVSSVLLVSECQSQGEMRVSCSSEGGDSPQYSWTLDGQTLTDTQLLSGNTESNNITLRQDVSGRLVCSVRNNVSEERGEKTIRTCGFIFIDCISNGTHISKWVFEANNTLCIPTTTAGTEGKETSITPSTNITSSNENVTSTCTDDPWYIRHLPIIGGILAALLILLMVGLIVVCIHKKKKSIKPEGEEDEHELTYADVKIVRKHRQQMQPRAEAEVEYGQVRFAERPVVTAQPEGDDCVYTVVRKNR